MKYMKNHFFSIILATGILTVFIISAQILSSRDKFALAQLEAIENTVHFDLSLVFKAQKKHHQAFGTYTTDLIALDFIPRSALYLIGFIKANQETDPEERKDLHSVRNLYGSFHVRYSPLTRISDIRLEDFKNYCTDCTATDSQYRIMAVAYLPHRKAYHIVTMNQNGEKTTKYVPESI